jgi:hypothetical protein
METNNNIFLQLFIKSVGDFKKWTGINALNWAKYVDSSFSNELLNKKLTRMDLLSSDFVNSLDDRELSCAILSWGGMNREHGSSLFTESEWLDLVREIRSSRIQNREDAYKKFFLLKKQNKLPGMGPAYYTKLVCFLNPKLNGYIMDQWTAKSVNLLCKKEIVKLTPNGFVDPLKNDVIVYQTFCEVIDQLSIDLQMIGIDVEESMFSSGGKRKGQWRKVVLEQWNLKNSEKLRLKLNDDFEVSTYDEVFEKTVVRKIQIDTLAFRSKFEISSVSDEIVITLSSGKRYKISKNIWELVLERIQELPIEERLLSSRYVDGKNPYNWLQCPNRVICPYIPAIMRHFNL